MKKIQTIIYCILIILVATKPINAQLHCGSTEAQEKIYQQHPNLLQLENDYSTKMDQLIQHMDIYSNKKTRSNDSTIIIPIVFHILHNYGSENITDAQIYDEVKILNNDYNKRNADTSAVLASFIPKIANCNYEFRLARKDPKGNCTNGIDRIYTYKTNFADDFSKVNQWPNKYYLNVWVVSTIGSAGVAGYAYKPVTANQIPYYDGIIILNDYIGSFGTGTTYTSRALTHEIGHYLGLDHTWGGTNQPKVACGDDGVFDTPNTKGHDACTTADLYDSTCTQGVIENTQNFMEYSYCSNMFTKGQNFKMSQTLNDVFYRGLFQDSSVQISTGILQPSSDCAPTADFYCKKLFICPNTNTSIADWSHGDTISSRTWASTGGNLSSTSAQNITVNYSTPGWKNVELICNSNAGSDTLIKKNYIYVANNTYSQMPNTVQDFEDTSTYNLWPTFNYFNNRWQWKYVNNSGINNSKCLKYEAYYMPAYPYDQINDVQGDYDDFITPAFNLSGINAGTPTYLNFYTSAASYFNINLPELADSMTISYSTNCGVTWKKITVLKNDKLFNKTIAAADYKPTNFSDWKANGVLIPSTAISANTYFKFQFNPTKHNLNFYMDNIGISNAPTGIFNTEKENYTMHIFPNPSFDNDITIQIANTNSEDCELRITDLVGKEVLNYSNHTIKQSLGNIKVERNKFYTSGLYIAQLIINHKVIQTQKIEVN